MALLVQRRRAQHWQQQVLVLRYAETLYTDPRSAMHTVLVALGAAAKDHMQCATRSCWRLQVAAAALRAELTEDEEHCP